MVDPLEPNPKVNCGMTYDLVECAAYQSDDASGSRTGCALRGDLYGHYIWFQFNAAVNGTLARNTFQSRVQSRVGGGLLVHSILCRILLGPRM